MKRKKEKMIEILLHNPRILHQKPDDEDGLPEFPIAACTDASGLIVLSQEGRSSIVINRASVPELCQMIRMLAALHQEE
jgi:hypothetical protein